MNGDIEEIEQFLNQIELLMQSRSPLGRKTADEGICGNSDPQTQGTPARLP